MRIPVRCVHDVGLVVNTTLWLVVPAPTGKLKSTVVPGATVTELSVMSLLDASWNQFFTSGVVLSCATIPGRLGGVAVGVAVGVTVGVAVGVTVGVPVTVTLPSIPPCAWQTKL